MEDTVDENQDLALVIAWPDKTARGDERWMALLKQLGIVKNLNFRVGHAAIVLIRRRTGTLAYFDFGRYITPRGYGRGRSAESDPRLALHTRAQVGSDGKISNLAAILTELHQREEATHGGGRMFFSIAMGLSHAAAARFAQRIVEQGPVKYGAVAPGNNSCSRFVAQVLLAGFALRHPARKRIGLPESIKPSPMSNVVNASQNRMVYCYHEGVLEPMRMSRWRSLAFQLDLLFHNLSTAKAKKLPCDREPGSIAEPDRPAGVPLSAQWLGGIGEGAWYALERGAEQRTVTVVKYASDGNEEYRAHCPAGQDIDPTLPYLFTYHCHHRRHVVVQNGREIVLETCRQPNRQAKTA